MFASSDWTKLLEGRSIQVAPLTQTVTAEFVHFQDRKTDDGSGYDGDNYIEGESECYVIFKVGEKYYKKCGYKSSYGYNEIDWNGPCTEVEPIIKTIQVWE